MSKQPCAYIASFRETEQIEVFGTVVATIEGELTGKRG
jgi:hypothetical protein